MSRRTTNNTNILNPVHSAIKHDGFLNVRFSVVKGKTTETETTKLVLHGLQKKLKLLGNHRNAN